MKIAVYGTLKRNHYAHYLMEGSEFLGEGKIIGYALYNDGLPVITPSPGSSVVCEVYDVTIPRMLSRLNRYEGYINSEHPKNLYNLIQLDVEGHTDVSVYVYNGLPSDDAELIEDGVWK